MLVRNSSSSCHRVQTGLFFKTLEFERVKTRVVKRNLTCLPHLKVPNWYLKGVYLSGVRANMKSIGNLSRFLFCVRLTSRFIAFLSVIPQAHAIEHRGARFVLLPRRVLWSILRYAPHAGRRNREQRKLLLCVPHLLRHG